MQQLNINANMVLHEIKSKLIKRSMELWGKQLHENAVIKEENYAHIICLNKFLNVSHI